jgi:Zn-finger nucleic acid-binding protein
MKCPNCNETLLMTERNQIEIDYCPSCRGVWLDKGELDKMLEYADQHIPYRQQHKPYGFPLKQQTPNPHYNKYHKKKSFLGDLFDFD